MTTLSQLVDVVAAVEGLDGDRVAAVARAVREAGLIATYGRGTSAAKMGLADAANFLADRRERGRNCARGAGNCAPISRVKDKQQQTVGIWSYPRTNDRRGQNTTIGRSFDGSRSWLRSAPETGARLGRFRP